MNGIGTGSALDTACSADRIYVFLVTDLKSPERQMQVNISSAPGSALVFETAIVIAVCIEHEHP